MIDIMKVGKKIEECRTNRKLTQNDLAQALYVSHQAVSKWERGLNLPSVETLVMITELFETTFDELIFDIDIQNSDFQKLLKTHSREAVIKQLINSESLNKIVEVFYLLSVTERITILTNIINNKSKNNIFDLWPYLSMDERYYVLSHISKEVITNKVYSYLTDEEKNILKKRRFENGI